MASTTILYLLLLSIMVT